MINEILKPIKEELEMWDENAAVTGHSADLVPKALTAIYEIGLEVIGKDEKVRLIRDSDLALTDKDEDTRIRNELRASQRKAWAKACGVAE